MRDPRRATDVADFVGRPSPILRTVCGRFYWPSGTLLDFTGVAGLVISGSWGNATRASQTHTVEAAGSNPAPPTKKARQLRPVRETPLTGLFRFTALHHHLHHHF